MGGRALDSGLKSTGMAQAQREIWLAGAPLAHWRHVCAFFRTADEKYQVLVPFIKQGLERGERAFHVVDPALREDHLRRLEQAGIDVAAAQRTGQLEVHDWEQAYLRGGGFDQEAMLGLFQEILEHGRTAGYPRTRLVMPAEWVLEPRPGVDDLVEYEARANDLLSQYDDPVICTYDISRFGAGIMVDILRTHPVAIIGGLLQVNPFFLPPDQFLRELHGPVRRVRRAEP
jgi:hypothetical protein